MKYYSEILNNIIYTRSSNLDRKPKEGWVILDLEPPVSEQKYGISLYKYENGQCVRRTAEEVQADIDAIPLPEPTEIEYLKADMNFLTMENESLQADVEQAKADIDYLLMLTEE